MLTWGVQLPGAKYKEKERPSIVLVDDPAWFFTATWVETRTNGIEAGQSRAEFPSQRGRKRGRGWTGGYHMDLPEDPEEKTLTRRREL